MTTPNIPQTPDPQAPPRAPQVLRPVLGLLAALGIMVLVVVFGTLMATLAMLPGKDLLHYQWTMPYALTNLFFAVLGAVAGGFAASRITRGHTLFTVFLLALITAVSGLVPVLKRLPPQNGQPNWYPLAIAVLVPLSVLLGGYLERRKGPPDTRRWGFTA